MRPSPERPRPRSILVVEDDADTRESLRAVLEVARYDVRTASNGREALEVLARIEAPGLILLDLMMPVMSGFEFLAARREDAALERIPVVIVSAWRREAEKTKGAQGFIQ